MSTGNGGLGNYKENGYERNDICGRTRYPFGSPYGFYAQSLG